MTRNSIRMVRSRPMRRDARSFTNTLGGLHRAFVSDNDGGTVLMGRQCRLDTGHHYMVTRMFQPIDRRQVREQANWMLLLDALGFDIKNQEGW